MKKKYGTVVFAHTVNEAVVFGILRANGVYGVYTDILYFEGINHHINN